MSIINHQIKLAARPVGLPKESDWVRAEAPIPSPGTGEVLTKTHYMSVDPAMRGWMNDRPSYVPPVGIGEVMRALTVGEVIESNNDGFAVGDFVAGIQGVQEYALSDGSDLMKADLLLAPAPAWLNSLGIAGLTAYCGLIEVGQPQAGETVVVSGAAGAVGAHAGQIAKIKGCRVVGIAGGPEKCAWIKDTLGFDAAIDYHAEDVPTALAAACPDGIDVVFENVGGDLLDLHAALGRRHEGRPAGLAVDQHAEIELARDIAAVLDVDPLDLTPGRSGLMGDQVHADHVLGCRLDGLERLDDLDATALAAPAGVDLGLDHPHRTAEPLGDGDGLLRGIGDAAVRHRHSVFRQQRLGLIFMNVHCNLAFRLG